MSQTAYWRSFESPLRTGLCALLFISYLGQSTDSWSGDLLPVGTWSALTQKASPIRLGVLETDVWRESVQNGYLSPWPKFPIRQNPTGILNGAHFTPGAYLEQARHFMGQRTGGCDVLMYYGGRRHGNERQGLNFNSWNADELRDLRALGGRPFIGLETMDPVLILEMMDTLRAGGFAGTRLYIRIAAEPSGMAYGTLDGTPHGQRHTAACFNAYRRRFADAAHLIKKLGWNRGIEMQIVFAGDSAEDFNRYMPDPASVDALGFDLYVTPVNIMGRLNLLRKVISKYPNLPIVFPELGIATAGMADDESHRGMRASPAWARAALADVLSILSPHGNRVRQITFFSVNVTGRLASRRWSWAWTPAMFEMLQEWQKEPKGWTKEGFHSYNPRTYPLGKDVVYKSGPTYHIVFRKVAEASSRRPPLFLETFYLLKDQEWQQTHRYVSFNREGLLVQGRFLVE